MLIRDAGGNQLTIVQDGAVNLFYDNSLKFETMAAGCRVASGNLYILDNSEINIGNGNDLKIYHNGNHSFLENTTGDLYLRSDDDIFIQVGTGDELAISIENDAAVQLYYDGSKKFETRTGGVTVTGQITASGSYSAGDSIKYMAGDGDDLQIYHDGTNTHLHNATGEFKIRGNDVRLMNAAGNELYFAGFANSYSCLLYTSPSPRD